MDYGTSPYAGMVNFDNLLWSLLTLFTVTTLQGWSKVTNVGRMSVVDSVHPDNETSMLEEGLVVVSPDPLII